MITRQQLEIVNRKTLKYPLHVAEKEIRKPITKANIKTNWKIISTQKEKEMNQIYYSRKVEDGRIMTMIQDLPFTEIN